MPDPSVPELIRFSFKLARELESRPPFELDWPADHGGQASTIRQLIALAESQPWAFDKLHEIARDYRKQGVPGTVPVDLMIWSYGVVSGAIKRPGRGPGRPSRHVRDRLIVQFVGWLRQRGATRNAAITQVADAACISFSAVEKILLKHS